MNTIILQAGGEIFAGGYKIEKKPLSHLSSRLLLDEGVTLRSYFKMLENYPELRELNDFFPVFLENFRQQPPDGCRCDRFDHLVFTKTVEMIGFPGDPRLEIYLSLLGSQATERVSVRDHELDALLDMKILLGKLKHVVFGDKMDVFEFDTVFTLFEFIDGIAWELGFQGAPTECRIRR